VFLHRSFICFRHNGTALSVIQTCLHTLPHAKSFMYFDTVFHNTIPLHISTYAIDQEIATKRGLRKYGFHGLSCTYHRLFLPHIFDKDNHRLFRSSHSFKVSEQGSFLPPLSLSAHSQPFFLVPNQHQPHCPPPRLWCLRLCHPQRRLTRHFYGPHTTTRSPRRHTLRLHRPFSHIPLHIPRGSPRR